MIVSSRTAGNWASLKAILSYLETECLSAAVTNSAIFDMVLLENKWKPTPAEILGHEFLIFLHVDAQALRLARTCREFNPGTRMIFFLAADAPALCQSFFSGEHPFPANSHDLFLVLCAADGKLVQQVFPQAQLRIVGELDLRPAKPIAASPIAKFVYAGRISFNKNLHTLVLAYAQAHRQAPALAPLHLYGFQDSSVQQFREASVENYQQKIVDLVDTLGLTGKVILHAHTTGEHWENLLSEEGIVYVSASLNADENYGLAPREFIQHGHRAILPKWGGFNDVLAKFPARTRGIPVVRSSLTTVHVSLVDFAALLLEEWKLEEKNKSVSAGPRPSLFHVEKNVSAPIALAIDPDIVRLHGALKKIKEDLWHDAGPYRSLHHSSELVKRQIDCYTDAPVTAAAPANGVLVPWLLEKDGNWQSIFGEDTPVAKNDFDKLWQRGWLY